MIRKHGPRGPSLIALVVAGQLIALPLGAQEGPIRLFGGQPQASGPAPAPAPPTFGPATVGDSGIVSQSLGTLNADGHGLLDGRTGGLGVDMWTGTAMSDALTLVHGLPLGSPSRAMSALARRVLLTTATPPSSVHGDENGALMPARAEALFRMGLQGDLADMLAQVPDKALSDDLRAHRMEARLLQRQFEGACDDAGTGASSSPDPLFQRTQVFCEIQAGRTDAASLGMDMLRELGQADGAFLVLAERLGGLSQATPPPPKTLDALAVTLYREAQEPFPDGVLGSGVPWLDRAVALSGPAAPPQRLEGGERAEASGSLPPDALRFMYGDTPFDAVEKARSLNAVLADKTPMSRALAYQIIQGIADPQARMAAIAQVLEQVRATTPALYLTQARVYLPLLREVPVMETALPQAPAIARALYGAGESRAGAAWLRFLQTKERESALVQAAIHPLWNMDRVANHRVTTGVVPLTAGGTQAFTPGPDIPLERLTLAATRRATAETALLALTALGNAGGPVQANWIILDEAARALEAVGLADAAATLVLEALATRME
ncbi:MAG: hypothetical protein K9H25_17775 [Rhodospirillum sp.]|nr:hypothetical protein [Rhodospirillum sp.]MCF8489134.1 hypothetical protein [Rhodospirillum sp.]MCF8502385.1 hypothetical protein [Rhodospirillum sp.]